ncbi:hypothetical protein [Allosphingosinicella indica]|uniref:Uncharacterized protein n=1 Tax=Allosphingosinicella indica TaxID=941907 RepID=A0A1X7GJB7_9SPHN|nr:hypothetical protein [Allosphingosinicella indica]SMF70674.1 hypothetical protein SAMN06295910_1926 [Allosphingosinicella indica]
MLNSPASFPHAGSYALREKADGWDAVRILNAPDAKGEVTVAIVGTAGSSGNTRVALSTLIDGTPLTDAERAEMNALMGRGCNSADGARREELMDRDHRACRLAAMLNAADPAQAGEAA